MQYNFEWDPEKAHGNVLKHGVSFEIAAQVFADPLALTVYDEESSSPDEDRWVTLGEVDGKLYLVVVHTYRSRNEDTVAIRLISARHATNHEIKQYQEG